MSRIPNTGCYLGILEMGHKTQLKEGTDSTREGVQVGDEGLPLYSNIKRHSPEIQ
jgi:hypothetical protein